MQIIPLHEIIIPENRIRKEFDPKRLKELADSIESKGMFNPINLEDDGKTLACGERRLRAVAILAARDVTIKCNGEDIPFNHIPFTLLKQLTPLERREAELEENVCRHDLSIQEYSSAVAELHKLRIEQHGGFDPKNGKGWTLKKTAEEIAGHEVAAGGQETKEIREALIIANNLDDPFVAAAKNKSEALRAVRDRKKLETRQAKTKEFKASETKHHLLLGDSFQIVLSANTKRFDIVVTDPPYGMDLHETSMFDGQEHEYDDSNEAFEAILNNLPELLWAVTKEQAHAYVFCDIRRFNELFAAFELAGWTCWPRPLIWHKGNIGSYGAGEFGFRQTYDAILFANKGERPLNSVYDEVIRVNQPTNLRHPAGKPPVLYEELIRRSSMPGDLILDPFCGSGPIFPAAEANHCVATGIEINPKYHEMAQETIMEMKK